MLDKKYDGRYAGIYDGRPYDWEKKRDEEKARKARKERALVKYVPHDRKKLEDERARQRELMELRAEIAEARRNAGTQEVLWKEPTRPIPSDMERRVIRDAKAQADGESIAARIQADAKRVVRDAELGIANPGSAERIQQEWERGLQSPEDEKKKLLSL